ncbi:hypothetical protein [Paraburkholderia sp. HD33-4]|uniref:hypothetical protein n=1 Tax=Paraburkholderia sp. HD33-4 TaxID=2883242 RepID=UPI001F2E5776|nr:hypothetical protein [Paraburkholderia sp. HD33-4]
MKKQSAGTFVETNPADTAEQKEADDAFIETDPVDSNTGARYLSDWDDDIIRFDARDLGSKISRIESIDLNAVNLGTAGNMGIYRGQIVPLITFPQFVLAIKIAVKRTLSEVKTNLLDHVRANVNHCLRFFSFLIGRGIYSLPQVTREISELYKHRILQFGWWKANCYNIMFRRVLRRLRSDSVLQNRLRGRSLNNTFFTLNISELEQALGLPIAGHLVPGWFYGIFQRITDEVKPYKTADTSIIEASHGSCQTAFNAVNKLYFSMDGFDSLPFKPYPRPASIADKRFGRPGANDGRTDNLSLPTVVKIVELSLRWLYDYGPSLMSMLKSIRAKLEAHAREFVIDRNVYARFLNSACETAFEEFQSIHNLPLSGIFRPVHGASSIRNLVLTHQVAMFFNIVACCARRRNELVGQGKDYGLHFGCLREIVEGSEQYKMDVYIEKTLFDYTEYWAPNIAVKSIQSLEELSQIFRPLNSPEKQYSENIEVARRDKLFSSRNFTFTGFADDNPIGFDLARNCEFFFKLAEIDGIEIFGRNRNVFRRFYCLVYVNRYDNPVLAALRYLLNHSTVYETSIYGLDPHGRKPDKKAAKILRRIKEDDLNFRMILAEVREEHLTDKIVRLLKGENIGGPFARLLLKMMTRLSADATFVASPVEVKAKLVTECVRNRGFAANEKDNGICVAGTARHAARKAHCFDGYTVRPELAGPKICSGCINLLTSEGYRKYMRSERHELMEDAQDMSLSRAHRDQLLDDVRIIDAYLEADEKVAAGNQEIVVKLVRHWSELLDESKE